METLRQGFESMLGQYFKVPRKEESENDDWITFIYRGWNAIGKGIWEFFLQPKKLACESNPFCLEYDLSCLNEQETNGNRKSCRLKLAKPDNLTYYKLNEQGKPIPGYEIGCKMFEVLEKKKEKVIIQCDISGVQLADPNVKPINV